MGYKWKCKRSFYNFKISAQMTSSFKVGHFDSEIMIASEESVDCKVKFEDPVKIALYEEMEIEDSETRIKRSDRPKIKPIAKKGKRQHSKSGKWSGPNRLNYYKAILSFSIEHPYYMVSWQYWKPEKFYPRMVQEINRNEKVYRKDVIQTKSFDERQRKEYFEKSPSLDMIPLSLAKLKEVQKYDSEAKSIISEYEQKSQQKSVHMRMLEDMMQNIKSKAYDIEDIHNELINRGSPHKKELSDCCFYS